MGFTREKSLLLTFYKNPTDNQLIAFSNDRGQLFRVIFDPVILDSLLEDLKSNGDCLIPTW